MLEKAKASPQQKFGLDTVAVCHAYEGVLDFFAKAKLTLDSQQKLEEFQKWKQQFNQLLQDAK